MTKVPVEIRTREHYSSLTTHRVCPQSWFYKYEKNFRKLEADIAPPRDFGSWWHAVRAAESLERGRALGSLKYTPRKIGTVDGGPEFVGETVTVEEVLTAADSWWNDLAEEQREEWEDWQGQDMPTRLRNLLRKWQNQWSEEREHEQPLAVELYWERELPQAKLTLFGFIDEVYLDTKKNIVVVRDAKTAKNLDTNTSLDDMMDSQLQLYAWGATPLIKSWDVGPVRAISYDRVKSTAPKPPTLTLAGRLAVRGGEPSISGSDLETYLEWAKGEDGKGIPWGEEGEYFKSGPRKGQPKFGRYVAEQTVIDRLKAPIEASKWMQRTLTPVNTNLVRTHLVAAINTANDIGRTRERSRDSGDAPRNFSFSCNWCDFQALCRAQMFGGVDGVYDLEDFGLMVKPPNKRQQAQNKAEAEAAAKAKAETKAENKREENRK